MDIHDIGSPYGETDESVMIDCGGEPRRVSEGIFSGVDINVHIGASYYKDYNFQIRDGGDTLAYVGATANHGGAPVRKPLRLDSDVKEALESEFGVSVIDARDE
jgi:hypothetical protein